MPQSSAQPRNISDDSIKAFMDLDDAGRTRALRGMSDDAKKALLTGIKGYKPPAAAKGPVAVPSKGMPAPPKPGLGDTYKSLGRGLALGAASGAGIPETTSGFENVTGFVGNAAKGLGTAVKDIAMDPIEGTMKVLDNMADNMYSAGHESWEGWQKKDPEQFAHGLGSLVTQVLTLKRAGETKPPAVSAARTLGKTAAAIDAGAEQFADLKKAMPEIVKSAKRGGVQTIDEFGKTVAKAHDAVNQQFNQGFAPIANRPYIPMEVSRSIMNLITPDMAKTAEGRAQIKYLTKRAREYQKPWTLKELNAKRMTENENLRTYMKQDTRGQSASPLQTSVSKAIADSAADVVYDQWTQANPRAGISAAELKARHGSLWALDDYINHPKKGLIANLDVKQAAHEEKGFFGRIKAHGYVSPQSPPHGYLSGIQEAFSAGPKAAASAKIRQAGRATAGAKVRRYGVRSLPIDHLLSPPPDKVRKTPFAPPPSEEDDGS